MAALLERPPQGAHLVEFFENDEQVLDSIETFLRAGLTDHSALVVIATKARLEALHERMGNALTCAWQDERYVEAEAEDLLARFMVDGWPDKALFNDTIGPIVEKVRGPMTRPVRAYGEMVAVLVARGNSEAALRLENLWNEFLKHRSVLLFCAYPRRLFSEQSPHLRALGRAHTHVI